ncbi:MAG: OmpW family outer membrane protein [Pseudomonadales bacterium]
MMKNSLKSVLFATTAVALLASGYAAAYEAGDYIFRAGPTTVSPNEDSGTVAAIAGSELAVNESTQLGLTLTYMYSDHIGIELLAATPFDHDVSGNSVLVGAGITDIASSKQLPPTLTVNYYPAAPSSKIQPFFGAGINYTIFFDEQADSAFETIAGSTDVELDDSWGLALRAGVDYQLSDNWALSASMWYIDIDTEATLKTSNLGTLKVDVDIDPYVYMVGLSYKF